MRSEYLYRKKLHDRYWYIPPFVDIALEFIELNRFFLYLMLFFTGDALRLWRDYKQRRKEQMELQLLKESFELDENAPHMSLMNMVSSIDAQEGDDSEIIFDEKKTYGEGQEGQDRKEAIRMALNEYINERLKEVSTEYKAS